MLGRSENEPRGNNPSKVKKEEMLGKCENEPRRNNPSKVKKGRNAR